VRAAPDMALTAGAALPVDLKSARLHLFDATTGARLPARFGPARPAT
jgi:hypothetical protein